MTTVDAVLALERVTRTFGALRAVDSVSLEMSPGERRAVIGPNGAGKTTLFNVVSGTLPPTAGRVCLLGRDINHVSVERRTAMGLARTYQITDVFLGLTVERNILLAALALTPRKFDLFGSLPRSGAEVDLVEHLLESLHLASAKTRLARELSHGEQRQLEVALALAARPKILLLDEPMAGLSTGERSLMTQLLHALPRELTVVLIEHDMDVVLELADRVTCLHHGQVIAEGSPSQIRDNDLVQHVYLGA